MTDEQLKANRARAAEERRHHFKARQEAVKDVFRALRARAKTEGFKETPEAFEDKPGKIGPRLRLSAAGVGTAAVSQYQDTLAFFIVDRGASTVVPLVELDDLPVRFDPQAGRFVALDGTSDVVDLLIERLRHVCSESMRLRTAP